MSLRIGEKVQEVLRPQLAAVGCACPQAHYRSSTANSRPENPRKRGLRRRVTLDAMIRAHQPAGILETIHERHLRNHAAHAPVGRSDHDRMGCGTTRPPDADCTGFVEGHGKCDCIARVANLPLRLISRRGFLSLAPELRWSNTIEAKSC